MDIRRDGDHRASVCNRSPEAAVMSFADEDTKPGSAVLSDEAFPVVDRKFGENSLRVLGPHTGVQIQRLLIRLVRDPMTFLFGLVLPIFFLLVLNTVLGQTISSVTGHSV